jgi:O-succinylbenzoate synthase
MTRVAETESPDVIVFDLPMRLRFRGQVRRSGVLLRGAAGWGEFSPFPDYDDATCARWLAAAREAADEGYPAPVRERVPVNTTVPAVDAERAHQLVRASGCTTAKVKVAEPGQTLADDIARVEAVRDALGPTGKLRIDANAAWTVDGAVKALKALDAFALEYAEQPVPTLEEMAQLRRRTDVLKVQPIGGVRRCLEVAEACGLPVVVSSAVESSVGIAAGVALAAALPELPFACGLGTVSLLDGDVTTEPLLPERGELPVRAVAPDPGLARADDELRDWWLARMEASRRAGA